MITNSPGMPQRRNVMITDLDDPDSQQVERNSMQHQQPRVTYIKRQRNPEKRELRTISGNFKRRSRSAECQIGLEDVQGSGRCKSQATKTNNYFNELLQTKDKQMQELLQRLATLHQFNENFAEENKALRSEVQLLNEKVLQLNQRIKHCMNCRKLQKTLRNSADEMKAVNSDINMLKTLVYRLNVQIEQYQDQLRIKANASGRSVSNSVTDPLSLANAVAHHPSLWTGSLHTSTLAPLLTSYDEMLKERLDLIQQYKSEFQIFTGHLKSVVEENTRLLQVNESLKRDFGNWREERTRLQAQADVCRAKAEAQMRKCDLAKEKLVEVMQCYEQKMQSMALDMEHLQNAYTRCKAELASLKSPSARPEENIAHSLQECKKLLEQQKSQHSREKSSLEKQLIELREQMAGSASNLQRRKDENVELQQALDAQVEQVEELRKRNSALQRALEKAKRSVDCLKARLRIALQWAHKLEEGQANMHTTWDALKRLETIVKHKESQVRGLQARHLEELDKMQQKLKQREETIRNILRSKLEPPRVAN